MVMAAEHGGKVIFKLLLCKNWGVNWDYSIEATQLGAFIRMKCISYTHMDSCSHTGLLAVLIEMRYVSECISQYDV